MFLLVCPCLFAMTTGGQNQAAKNAALIPGVRWGTHLATHSSPE